MKIKNNNWIDEFKKIENETGHFGHNTEFDFLPAFKKIEKFGGKIISFEEGGGIKIVLPKKSSEQLLIHLLTNLPGHTNSKFNKKNNELFLEWHY